jgi:hypothetical protein
MHTRECEAYRLLNELKDLAVPRAFYIEEGSEQRVGVIVLEDVNRGTRLLDVFESASQAHCFDLAEQIAKLQVSGNAS